MSDISKDGSDEIYYCFEKDVCIRFNDTSKKMVIQYQTNTPLSVRLKNKTAVMLRLLLQNRGKTMDHCTIAKQTGCNCYRDGVENDEVMGGVRNIRNLLVDVLKEAGIPDRIIKKIIVPVENVGYKVDLPGYIFMSHFYTYYFYKLNFLSRIIPIVLFIFLAIFLLIFGGYCAETIL